MTDKKYMPGPWMVLLAEDDVQIARMVVTKAEAEIDIIATIVDAYEDDRQRANAHLIAAAPDLLETLRKLRDEVQRLHVGYDERSKDCPVCRALDAADAAIAKAEARAS